MPEEKESILKRIQKLLKMSEDNGASENEAMLAAKKAQELLSEHNLSRSDIKDDTQAEPIEKEQFDVERDNWRGWIQSATAKLYFCQMYTSTRMNEKYRQVKTATFVGRKSNRIVAKSMCDYFINTVLRLADKEFESVPGSKSEINRMKQAFKLGCASRLFKTQGVTIVSKKSSMNIRDRAAYYNGKAKGNGIGLDTQVNNATRSRMLGR